MSATDAWSKDGHAHGSIHRWLSIFGHHAGICPGSGFAAQREMVHIMVTPFDRMRSMAIMQPYFFPYLGYYQLAGAVERFLFYDDVQFIKGGYIARNRVLLGQQEWMFSVPLAGASSNKLITEVKVDVGKWPTWKSKFLRTLAQNYVRAPQRDQGLALVEEVLQLEDDGIGTLAAASVTKVMKAIGRTTRFQRSSEMAIRRDLTFEDRILHVCQREGVELYLQSPGGAELYSCARWEAEGIALRFLRPSFPKYLRKGPWLPGLSIIDILMHVELQELSTMLDQYTLFTN